MSAQSCVEGFLCVVLAYFGSGTEIWQRGSCGAGKCAVDKCGILNFVWIWSMKNTED